MKRWDWLIHMIKFHAFKIGAEVGVDRGQTTAQLLAKCPDLCLFAVDNWAYIPDNPSDPEYRQIGLEGRNPNQARREFDRRAGRFARRLIILQGDSVEMAKKVEDDSLDFVFIDADHRYASALADIKAWVPKVKEDGVVCGHDYNHPRFPGVTKAVHECFGDRAGDAQMDYVWYAKREDFLL